MKVQVTTTHSSKAETLIVFAAQKKSNLSLSGVSKEVQSIIKTNPSFNGEAKSMCFFRNTDVDGFNHLLVVGLGESKDHESLRQAAARVLAKLKAEKVHTAALDIESLNTSKNLDLSAQALTEGFVLSSYSFDDFKKQKENQEKKTLDVEILCANKTKLRTVKKGHEAGVVLAEATNFSRWLGDSPGNKMTPTILGNVTTKEAKGSKLKVTVWNKAQIEKKKMGGLLGVAKGSSEEPRFIVMEYKGAAASKKPVCYVGKGLTFDAGGISLKPGPGMEDMKYDMCGGANVIGAMIAIARLKLKVNAIGIVPASENMPGPSANKPGDILTFMDGTTAEINNTDAEGRLILADALCHANTLKPAAIIDAATLTGAMVIALGSSHTGVYSNNDALVKKIEKAADNAGERVWRMPLCQDHTNDLKGTYADLSNIGCSREAGSATAAAFLKHFVDKDTPWAHFDIAGTAWHGGKRFPYHPKKGATGSMVRTFVELAKAY